MAPRPPKRNTQPFQVQIARNSPGRELDWRNWGTPKVHPTDVLDQVQKATRDTIGRNVYALAWHALAEGRTPDIIHTHDRRVWARCVPCVACDLDDCRRPAPTGQTKCNAHHTQAKEAADA